MNKTKMVSALAVVLALALVTGCASSGPSKEEQQYAEEVERQRQEAQRQRQEAQRQKQEAELAKAKPLNFWSTVPRDEANPWYRIEIAENNTVTVYTSGPQIMSLKVYDSNMKLIAENTGRSSNDQDERNARLEFPVEAGKIYFLNVIGLPTGVMTQQEARRETLISAELKQLVGTLTDGESMEKNGVTISYSDGLITMVNNSGKVASVRYRHKKILGSTSIGGTISLRAGGTREERPSWENPPKEITILHVALSEPKE